MSCFSRKPPPRVTSDLVLHWRTVSKVLRSLLWLLQDVHNKILRSCAACSNVQSVNVGNSGIKFSSRGGGGVVVPFLS